MGLGSPGSPRFLLASTLAGQRGVPCGPGHLLLGYVAAAPVRVRDAGTRHVLGGGEGVGPWATGSSLRHLLVIGDRCWQGDMVLGGRRRSVAIGQRWPRVWEGPVHRPAECRAQGLLPATPPRAPTALKRMLSKLGATVSVSPQKGQPPLFCSQRHPASPSNTSSMRRRRVPPTTAGTDVATAMSPVGVGRVTRDPSPPCQPHARARPSPQP